MIRLPAPGSDNGTWGDILNTYLEVSHTTDGTLKSNVVGSNQIQNNAVTNIKLDPGIQSVLTAAASAMSQSAADSRYIQQSELGANSGVAQLSSDGKLLAAQLPNSVVSRASIQVAYAATITPAVTAYEDLIVSIAPLTGDITINNPTGIAVDGQLLKLRLAQDATGGRNVTFGSAYEFGSDVTKSLIPTTASERWTMLFEFIASESTWWATAISRGYA